MEKNSLVINKKKKTIEIEMECEDTMKGSSGRKHFSTYRQPANGPDLEWMCCKLLLNLI